VNCRGDVREPRSGALVAGARTDDGQRLRDTERSILAGVEPAEAGVGENTTIGVVATNRTLDKSLCSRLASVAHDGIARAVVPAHTRWDGDTLFCLSTNRMAAPSTTRDHDLLDVAAAAAVSGAILNAVMTASGLPGLPAARDLGTA
jgi:L-aminopeptidase/D-esterase-like protein